MNPFLLTKKEAEKIIDAKEGKVEVSLDLGLSSTTIHIKDCFAYIKEHKVPLLDFSKVKEDACYVIAGNSLKKLAFFSDETNFYYKLVPTIDWPTITLSSTPMHRHISISPKQDTLSKIKEICPVQGRVLDSCCGLGYTAILSSKNADEVYTFERDKNILYMASLNPCSRELFSSKKIKIFEEDVFNAITRFKECFFDRIIHDPPTFRYSPMLYSKKFCFELHRVLKKGGILYHYSPCPKKTKGNVFYKSIIKNLKESGFKKVEYRYKSSGVRALKI